MKHLFISYELAVIAKAKGFDEKCIRFYNQSMLPDIILGATSLENGEYFNKLNHLVAAPLYQQIVDWFRNTHGIVITIYCSGNIQNVLYSPDYDYMKETYSKKTQPIASEFYDYYEAFNWGIQEAFKLI